MSSLKNTEKSIFWFIFQNNHLVIANNANKLLTAEAIIELKPFFLRQHLLAHFVEYDVYCAELQTTVVLPTEFATLPLRKALELLGPDWYNTLAKAQEIIHWDNNHQYCGRCGHSTIHQSAIFERSCPACSLTFYPRISPSVIVLIQKEKHILMARSPHFIPGAYGLIAGFVEPGENLEEAVHREVQEEVGIQIKNLEYFGSQAWPFPDSLMMAFTAKHAVGELQINQTEIETAGWFPFDKLPGGPSSSISIARKLIDHFVAEQKSKNL